MEKLTPQDLEKINLEAKKSSGDWIKVGMSTCGIAAGADEVLQTLKDEVKKRNVAIDIRKCGCVGMCYAEPLVEVKIDGLPPVTYGKVTREIAMKIVEKHVCGKMLVNDSIFELEAKG
ncbi:MAG TPA: (2Fe-2S) ferredoxin domain-containing protein [Candidatus Omnitrophota bacterium]|nr:(2Fe-2S) ferredoxin domain-containing protein [Candidatus Omnitrophota bacterium]